MYHICCDEKDVGEAELPSIPMIHNRWAGRHVALSLVKFAGSAFAVLPSRHWGNWGLLGRHATLLLH